jgi:ADP-ribose pyrophosphatase YjhB (NUDIX family)
MSFETAEVMSESTWFKDQSLELLATQLQNRTYPGYPNVRLSYANGASRDALGQLHLPDGPWLLPHDDNEFITTEQSESLYEKGYELDTENRPLHPWIQDLLREDVGVVTGKGFYRYWGPNFTADPVIIRMDTPEPMVLLVQRKDTKQWALAGGFVEPGESGEVAAFREAEEETLVDWSKFQPAVRQIYKGPLADIRFTANAWPETEAYGLYLDPELTRHLATSFFRGDTAEVDAVGWFTITEARNGLFGSHKLLVELAMQGL